MCSINVSCYTVFPFLSGLMDQGSSVFLSVFLSILLFRKTGLFLRCSWAFLFKLFLIRGSLLYNVVLDSAAQWSESALSTHVSPSSWASLLSTPYPTLLTPSPCRPLQSTELNSLCDTGAPHQLCILNLVVCIFQCCSLSSSHPLLPLLCPPVLQCLCLYSCPANRFNSTIFLDSICTHWYLGFIF